ncbi:MAG: MASE1 domain-containing protein [Rhodospirillales bacterium]|nr:MASE1 domain-containing protein [Rhodospirillales bacterium]
MFLARVLSWPYGRVSALYLAGFVLLDWLSFIHPFAPFGITPWNPPTGLSFALILLFGQSYLPLLFVAPLLADLLVRHLPLPIYIEAAMIFVSGAAYGGATLFLLRPKMRFDPALASLRDLVRLLAIAAISTAIAAIGTIAVLTVAGLIESANFAAAAVRLWVGDVIGIVLLTPFLLVILTRQRLPSLTWEMLMQAAAIVVALGLVFGIPHAYSFEFFYLLFLPAIWVAIRYGLEGAVVGLIGIQAGLIGAVQFTGQSAETVTSFQILMLVLSLTGLATGMLVSAQRRTETNLRLHQEALARVARLGGMSEFAAALAHEINQPLTAIGNYVRSAQSAITAPMPDLARVAEAVGKASAQVERAGEVVRRLREFIRLGRSERAPVALARIVEESLILSRSELVFQGIDVAVRLPSDLPAVMVDLLQIEQVLLNLLRNAAEAIAETGRIDGRIAIEAAPAEPGFVEVRVEDNGPGFDPTFLERPIVPFTTSKSEGTGIGLAFSRSIVENHGGRLWLGGEANKAVVHFTLPFAEEPRHAG